MGCIVTRFMSREGFMWDELEERIEVFKSADRTNLKQLLTSYKVFF